MSKKPIEPGTAWYCVKSLPKHEHIAAAHLARSTEDIAVYCPRLRIRRRTRRGAVWFVEAVFPGYLFAHFDWMQRINTVRSTPGVRGAVTFGDQIPIIPDGVVDALRAEFGAEATRQVGNDPRPGDTVFVANGPLGGCSVTVLCVLSSGERVKVLLDLLGQTVHAEVSRDQIIVNRSLAEALADGR
jgi:transcriptional antiterminator RfaH